MTKNDFLPADYLEIRATDVNQHLCAKSTTRLHLSQEYDSEQGKLCGFSSETHVLV